MTKAGREELEDELAGHWTETKASVPEIFADIAAATGRPVPPGAEDGDALAHLTGAEVAAVHAAVCGRCET